MCVVECANILFMILVEYIYQGLNTLQITLTEKMSCLKMPKHAHIHMPLTIIKQKDKIITNTTCVLLLYT